MGVESSHSVFLAMKLCSDDKFVAPSQRHSALQNQAVTGHGVSGAGHTK